MFTNNIPVILCLFLGLSGFISLRAQSSFFDMTDQIETWSNGQLAGTPDGGFIVGNNLSRPFTEDFRHGFYLMKYDSCGQAAWSKLYEMEDVALYFEDVATLPDGNIVALGLTGARDVFLMKTDPEGNVLFLSAYDNSEYDHNYSLQIAADKMMVFGSYLTENGARNYLMVTDMEGGIVWSKAYFMEVDAAEALLCKDGGALCRTGNTFYKIAENGSLEWAQKYGNLDPVAANISQPVELTDGYAFALRYEESDYQYVVKISKTGMPLWYSDQFESHFLPSDLQVGPDGHLYLVNSLPTKAGEQTGLIPMLIEFSPEGEILQQFQFEVGDFGRFIRPACLVNPDTSIVITGSYYTDANFDYVLKTKPKIELGCATVPFENKQSNDAQLQPASASTGVQDIIFERNDTLLVEARDLPLNPWEYCERTIEDDMMEIDTIIVCTDTFLFNDPLPGATYAWKDGSTEAVRAIKAPGTFQVTATTCNRNYQIDLKVELGYCPCDFYIPNAFSPNSDDQNDRWEVYATCGFLDYDLKVFDRWGQLLHHSTNPDDGWDGTFRGSKAPMGVYVYALSYSWELQPGRVWKEQTAGTIALMR